MTPSIFNEVEGADLRLPTGCFELDDVLGGGLPQGLTLFFGREKSGKSMVLSSLAAEAFAQGKHVVFVTLDLLALDQKARIMANLTGTPMDDLLAGKAAVSKERFAQLEPTLGRLYAKHFPTSTPVGAVLAWADTCVEAAERPIDLLVVDYLDSLSNGIRSSSLPEALIQKEIAMALRDYAIRHRCVCVSATQARRPDPAAFGARPLDLEDIADSSYKARIADVVIAMRMHPDEKTQVDYFVAASRHGRDRVSTGPLPTDRPVGRMWPVTRRMPW